MATGDRKQQQSLIWQIKCPIGLRSGLVDTSKPTDRQGRIKGRGPTITRDLADRAPECFVGQRKVIEMPSAFYRAG
jgi:hypothetical protein